MNNFEQSTDDSKCIKAPQIDINRIKISQRFDQNLNIKKINPTIKVRKPNRQEFVRTHQDKEYAISANIIEIKQAGEVYLVDSALYPELKREYVSKLLVLTINRQGECFLWPIKLPGIDGSNDTWNHSAFVAANIAMKSWIRVISNRAIGAYEVIKAVGDLSEPEWPNMDMPAIINIAFKDRYISDLSHPILKQLKGVI